MCIAWCEAHVCVCVYGLVRQASCILQPAHTLCLVNVYMCVYGAWLIFNDPVRHSARDLFFHTQDARLNKTGSLNDLTIQCAKVPATYFSQAKCATGSFGSVNLFIF